MKTTMRIISTILVVLFVIMIPVNIVLRMFDNTIALLLPGNKFWELVGEDENANYFTGDYATEAERLAAGQALCYDVEAEGAALLLNNDALPLTPGAKVSTLSSNSVNLVYGGTGSGNVDASKALNFKEALEKSGLVVNETLWNSYFNENGKPLYDRSSSAGESAALEGQAGIAEAPMSHYTDEIKNSIAENGDAVIITFSRIGGEGYDCEFPGYEGNAELSNYLELNSVELDLLKMAGQLKAEGKVQKIIVLLNCSNAIELDFLAVEEYGIDACLWVGGLGISGTEAVADILVGKVNPSGSLVDTYLNDNFSSPAMQNFIAQQYLDGDAKVSSIPDAISTYMVYQEGIYVGYKYYETRYYDYVIGREHVGEFDYHADVAYPFGYGLSYTNFVYRNLEVNYNFKTDQFEFSLAVVNVGDTAGKETVQIYVQSPYTEYDKQFNVEKAGVQLVGFAKTPVIEPGKSKNITVYVDRRDLASYDAYGHGTYILEGGDYYFTVATDAHNAVNNILYAQGYTAENTNGRMDEFSIEATQVKNLVYVHNEELLDLTYSTSINGTPIRNQLSDSDPYFYFGEGTVKMLSRQDWVGTWPTGDYKLQLSEQMVKELDNRYDNSLEAYEAIIAELEAKTGRDWHQMPLLDQGNDISLYDMFTADYDNNGVVAADQFDDPAWDYLLRNVTIDELVSIGDCFHWRHPVASVNAPGSRDENGPQGLTVALFGSGLQAEATAFTSEDVMAATFNTSLMNQVGIMIGNDCIDAGVSCLYGPGANTHRTPYGGRNFEYYSEDGFLAGEIGYAEISGILSKGVDVVMKHFALNDTEQNRLGQAAWLTEQAAREIYLKGFQKALEENGGRGGVMTAYTRWGTTWSAANYGLMSGILRGEWGNTSMHITDNMITPNCNAIDAIMAGGVTCFDAMMSYAVDDIKTATKDPVFVNAMVEAMHYNLYTIINSAAMNGVGENTVVKATNPAIVNTVLYVTIALGVVGVPMAIIFRKKTTARGLFFF